MKKESRRFFLNLRKRIEKEKKEDLDKKIYENLIESNHYKNSTSIFIFISMEDEVDTRMIIKHALENNKDVYVPKIREKFVMDAIKINSLDDIIEGKFKIPTSKLEESIQNPDLTIVAGLCYDYDKYRLGYGGGFYDNYIKNHDSKYIGIFYSICKMDKVPRNEYDMKLDYIITEEGLI